MSEIMIASIGQRCGNMEWEWENTEVNKRMTSNVPLSKTQVSGVASCVMILSANCSAFVLR